MATSVSTRMATVVPVCLSSRWAVGQSLKPYPKDATMAIGLGKRGSKSTDIRR
jgi:hypothetical protein